MIIKYDEVKKEFFAVCDYEQRMIPKDAGFRWNPDKKRWWTNEIIKVQKLIQYAEPETVRQIKRKIAETEAKIAQSQATNSSLKIPAPKGLQYFPFQKAGIEFISKQNYSLLADEMGCIDGESILTINRCRNGFKIKLKDAYLRFNNLSRVNWNWDKKFDTYTTSLQNGELRLNKIEKILYKGIKKVLKITTASGKFIKLTYDHELITDKNKWVAAQDLKVGDIILTNGKPTCKLCGGTENIITYVYSKFKGYCKQCMYRYCRKNTFKEGKFIDKDGYVRISGIYNHHRKNKYGHFVYEHILVMEKHLGRKIYYTEEEIHHINGIRSDNRVENLKIVNITEHCNIHNRYLHFGSFIPKEDKIVSIEKCGELEVYDIVMNNPHRNFVANGIIVHNCGKSIQAIGTLNYELKNTDKLKVLVICPASLKINWKREMEKWLVKPLSIEIVNTKKEFPQSDIVIINYDIVVKYEEELLAEKFDYVILDESQYLKNQKAKRTKATMNVVDKIKKIMCLTGTPLLNRPVELYTTLQILKANIAKSFFGFAKRYCDAKNNGYGWDFSGASNLEELQEKLRTSIMIRRLKKDVLKELPPKMRQIIDLSIDSGISKQVKKEISFMTEFENKKRELEEKRDLAFEKDNEAAYLEAVSSLKEYMTVAFTEMSVLRHESAVAKIPYVIDHIKDVLESQDKVVVFAHHKDVIAAICDAFGDEAVKLDGSCSSDEKQKAVDSFQNSKKIKLFVGSIKAAGVGITLTAASIVIFAELDWVPANLSQGEDRLHRIGQTNSVLVQHLVIDGSIDSHLAKLIVEKQDIIDSALDRKFDKEEIDLSMAGVLLSGATVKKKEVKEYNEETIKAIGEALLEISSTCDGAREIDGSGFNKLDSEIGKSFAQAVYFGKELSNKQLSLSVKMLKKYRRQISSEVYNVIYGGK